MKPERIEELARGCCEAWDEHTPMEVAAAIRTAIREFADEAIARSKLVRGITSPLHVLVILRDEVLGEEKGK